MLAEKGINPTEKILDLIPYMDEIDQAKVWLALLPYLEPKVTDVDSNNASEDLSDRLKDVSDEQLIKAIEYNEKKDAAE